MTDEANTDESTLTCVNCRQAQIQLVDYREYDGTGVWFYECPACQEGCLARESEDSAAPTVKWLVRRADDPNYDKDPLGIQKPAPYDILANNPGRDAAGRTVYWGQ